MLLLAIIVAVQAPVDEATVGPPNANQGANLDAAAVVDAPVAPVAPASGVLRVALQEPEVDGVEPRVGRAFASQLIREIRKLERTSAVSMDEVRALIAQEATKQLAGCDDGACIAEIADALGADEIVVSRLSRVGSEHVLSVRCLDAEKPSQVRAAERRFAAKDGEEFLVAIGKVVEELWPDRPLVRGAKRGVDKEVAKRLNPPPLPPVVFWSLLSGTALLAVGGAGAALVSSIADEQTRALLDESTERTVEGRAVVDNHARATTSAYVADGLLIGAAASALAAAATFFFTDFDGARDDD